MVFTARFLSLRRWLIVLFLAGLGFWLVLPPPAAAHPLGNFSVNRYSRLEVDQQQIRVFYVLDMAEIPAFQEWPTIDTDGDKTINPTEQARYREQQVVALQENLWLTVNGRATSLTPLNSSLSFPPGQGDLPTLRLEAMYTAPLHGRSWDVTYEDGNYTDRLGWREIVLHPGATMTLLPTTAPTADVSQALSQYPEDLLQAPLAVSRVTFRLETAVLKSAVTGQNLAVGENGGGVDTAVSNPNRFANDRFAQLITIENPGPGVLTGVLLLAFALGAVHALTPGHGKTIVAAYLVGSRGAARHALFLGLTTTITHTAGVFAFGLLVLLASRFILPEQLYPWLSVFSGLLVVAIGFSLLRGRWHVWRGQATSDHTQVTGYHTHFGVGHAHPSPAAPTAWRNLLALGVSGGLLPCPSALVLLLAAITLQKVAFGLLLIVLFSFGLASVLTGIGLTLVYAGRLFEKWEVGNGRFARTIPIFSALFITLVGLGMTARAIGQLG